jgi:hypothetical protein
MSSLEQHPLLWCGVCTHCLEETRILEDDLLQRISALGEEKIQQLQIDGAFTAECGKCATEVTIKRTDMRVVSFSRWQVLPAPEGVCPDCGVDHDPREPHDAQSLLYLYRWRSHEAQAGREERWPSWRDAMTHCTPEMQAAWIEELTTRGIDVDARSK